MNKYPFGSMVTLGANFTIVGASTPIDPTTVILRVTDPNGAETVYSGVQITRITQGQYSCNVIANTAPGFWNYRWEGAGAAVAADETRFYVNTTLFADAQP